MNLVCCFAFSADRDFERQKSSQKFCVSSSSRKKRTKGGGSLGVLVSEVFHEVLIFRVPGEAGGNEEDFDPVEFA
eukprot:scaffold13285_cov36-Cyclotella_meneghiniana.AAC.5